jgi:glycosyltransferase involved in cell wall biosynthesis
MGKPLVSIVMPVFNGGHYFPKSVASALAQSYDRFEIVIVNDGSRDNGQTAGFCEEIAAKHPDRILYIDKPNGGVGSALNAGISAMRGDIFCWLSHDDLYMPNKLERQVDFYNRLGKSDAMLISDYAIIDPHDNVKFEVRFNNASFIQAPKLPLYRGCVNGCTVFIPRKVLPDNPFKPQYFYTQDYWLWFELIKEHTFFHQPEVLVHYRQHPGQDSMKPEATIEGEELWRTAVDETTDLLRTQLYGSSWKFYHETNRILEPSYKKVAAYLLEKRDACLSDTPVSVVIPFFNEPDLAVRAARSVLDQTYHNAEVILVNDGSTDDISEVKKLAEAEPRVRLISQANAGASAARNIGLDACRGDYIAFLDGDDYFLPNKISVQLEEMAKAGAVISHTSYNIIYPKRFTKQAYMPSGRQTGRVYPRVLGQCMIATPTVMIHRSILAGGFRFPEGMAIGEDILAWLDVLSRHDILGIDQPLTVVEWSDTSAAVNIKKSIIGLDAQQRLFREHPIHRRHEPSITPLDQAIRDLQRLEKAGVVVNEYLIADVFQTPRPAGP